MMNVGHALCSFYPTLLLTQESNVTEKQLMIQIAELVPKHHGRTKKQEPAASTAGTSKGKGGKKKK